MDSEERKIIKNYANKISSRGFSTIAVFFLEMFKYLNFIFSQSMIFFGPLATVFCNSKKYYQISQKEAKEYVNLLSDKQLRELKKRMNFGGVDERNR